jgi:hypothetical protein
MPHFLATLNQSYYFILIILVLSLLT